MLYALLNLLPTGYILTAALLLGGRALPAYRATAQRQLVAANWLLLLVSLGVVVATANTLFSSLAARSEMENYAILNQIAGPYWFFYWGPVVCRGLLPQLFWFRHLRRSPVATALVALGLLLDFCSFLLLTLAPRDYLPSSWGMRPNYLALVVSALIYLALLAAVAALQRWLRPATARR